MKLEEEILIMYEEENLTCEEIALALHQKISLVEEVVTRSSNRE